MEFLKTVLSVFVKDVKNTSEVGETNVVDYAKIAKTAVLVGTAASLTWFVQYMTQVDLGNIELILVPIVTAGLNYIEKLVKDNKVS